MRVLVTGGAGFVGSHTVDALVEYGLEVAVLDNLSTGRQENLRPGVRLYRGDLLDRDFVFRCLKAERPEAIVHLAAQASAPRSLADPPADAGINIVGSVNLLEAARAAGAGKVVYSSSAAVYGNPRYLPVDLLHPVEPVSFYGLSKHTVERYLALYGEMYGLDFTVLRYANVYGPRQDARGEGGVVAVFTDRLLRGENPVIYGDGQQTRDFVHVSDVARANLLALDRGSRRTLNIGTGRPVTVNRLLEIMMEASGSGVSPRYEAPRPGDIRDSWLDGGPAGEALGWDPLYELEQGVKETLIAYSAGSFPSGRQETKPKGATL